jgi:hypothetical protein
MKHYIKSNMYKAANVSFNPESIAAFSYNWWQFVKVIDGLVVFNTFAYSVTTRKHQSKVRTLMGTLGITIDVEIEAPEGLQRDWSADSINLYKRRIEALETAIKAPRSNNKKNQERLSDIYAAKMKISAIVRLNESMAA